MSFEDVTPVEPETFQRLQLDGTIDQTPAINEKIDAAGRAGFLLSGGCKFYNEPNNVRWRVEIITSAGEDIKGEPGGWVVVSSLGPVLLMTDSDYRARFPV